MRIRVEKIWNLKQFTKLTMMNTVKIVLKELRKPTSHWVKDLHRLTALQQLLHLLGHCVDTKTITTAQNSFGQLACD
jgi:hypothetical protein